MTISNKTKVTLSVLVSVVSVVYWLSQVESKADQSARRLDGVEPKIDRVMEDISYIRGQWDAKFNGK